MRLSSTDVPNFLDSGTYSHKPCPPQFYFLKMGSCLIYLKNCWPPLLKRYFKSRLFPVISGLFELRKYFIFVLCFFHIWMLKKFPPLPHPCPLWGCWCLRSHPIRVICLHGQRGRRLQVIKDKALLRLVHCILWETAASPGTGTCGSLSSPFPYV